MKHFLKSVFLFIIIFCIVLFLVKVPYTYLKNQFLENKHLEIDPSVKHLIFGDSHTQAALNDQYISGGMNISLAAEHYLFTYSKLKKIISVNPQIKNVVLGFGYHNLSKSSDAYIFDDDYNCRTFARYFMILDNEQIQATESVSQNWRINYLKTRFGIPFQLKMEIPLLIKSMFGKNILISDFPFIGSYYASEKSNISDEMVARSISKHFYNSKNEELDLSVLNEKYLFKIIELLNQKEVNLFLVSTPLYFEYFKAIPEKHRNQYHVVLNRIMNEYPEVSILEYSQFVIEDIYFGDAHHLNQKGAKIFSKKINTIVNQAYDAN